MTANINANLPASGSDRLDRYASDAGARVSRTMTATCGNFKGVAVRL